MHEMAIAQALLDIVLAEAEDHNLIMVDRVVIQVGEMAAVVPKSLEFCFSILANHTVARGAKLIIEVTPVVARCSNCGEVFEVENFSFECPECSFVATKAKIFVINLMSSPGAGKTSLLEQTIRALSDQISVGVIEGDIQSSEDAERIQKTNVPVVQINTGGACHRDFPMG